MAEIAERWERSKIWTRWRVARITFIQSTHEREKDNKERALCCCNLYRVLQICAWGIVPMSVALPPRDRIATVSKNVHRDQTYRLRANRQLSFDSHARISLHRRQRRLAPPGYRDVHIPQHTLESTHYRLRQRFKGERDNTIYTRC